ncbi:MAG: hypothetical protein MK132_07885 [Lentisphaerales bacterium]|nr:hypothetical protein [Lentisphaerales bacterium]
MYRLTLTLFFIFFLSANAEKKRPALTVLKLKGPIILDGSLDDWQDVNFVEVNGGNGVFDGESSKAENDKDLSYKFAVCYDQKALYVAVEVKDDKLVTDDTKAGEKAGKCWMDDAVEVFLDGNHNRASNARDKAKKEYQFGGEFSLTANGAATSNCTGWPKSFGDAKYWSGAVTRKQLKDGSWIVCYEYCLSWSVMGNKPLKKGSLGFTIGVQDDDNGGQRDHALYWSGKSPSCWKDESGWGDLHLQP